MATVQNLLDLLQFRVDTANTDLYHHINNALRAIAKRLYWLESDIVRSEMSVPVWAKAEYTAATIAFAENTPSADTITDSANGFVIAGFKAGMHITTDHATNAGPYEIDTVAAGTITLIATDDLTLATAGSDVTITSDDSFGDLPADFGGLISKPHLAGKTYPLLPLPSEDVALAFTSAADPEYYQIKGSRIYVTPHTGTDYTIKADYFAIPTMVTAATDTMPYFDLFGDAIAEAIMRTYRSGEQVIGTDSQWWKLFCRENVDPIARKYGHRGPRGPRVNGIDWNRRGGFR